MNFLIPMCFICLQSKNDLNNIDIAILTKLLYCIEKTKDFFPSISNQTKICSDCLNNLNAAFHFKKICLTNIVQFKYYLSQLTDINKSKEALEFSNSIDSNHEQYSHEQLETACVKQEIFDENYFESCGNNEYQKRCVNAELRLSHNEDTFEEACKTQLQNQPAGDMQQETTDIHLEQHSDGQFKKLFVKNEILDDVCDEKLENQPEKVLEDHCQHQKASKMVTPEDERIRRRRESNKIAATKSRLKRRKDAILLVQESELLKTQNTNLKKRLKQLESQRYRLLDMLYPKLHYLLTLKYN